MITERPIIFSAPMIRMSNLDIQHHQQENSVSHPFIDFVQTITDQLDKAFNGEKTQPGDLDKKVGFILIVFPIGPQEAGVSSNGVVSTNGVRKEDVTAILKQQADLFSQGLVELKTEEPKAN